MSKQWRWSLAAAVGSMLLATTLLAGPGGSLLDLEVEKDAAGAPTVRLLADGPVEVESFLVDGPDRLVVDLKGYSKNGKHYVTVTSAYDAAQAQRFHVETKTPAAADTKAEGAASPAPAGENVEAVAKTTNARLEGWVFEIADYKYDAIFKPLAELTKK